MARTQLTLAAVLGLALAAPAAHAGKLESLLDKADRATRGQTSAGVFEMEVKTRTYRRAYKIVVWDDSRGKEDKSLVKILGPALWRGFGTLKRGSQLKIFNPKTNHVSVVSSSMLGDSWMGSHFTNDDLVKSTYLARDFNLSLSKKWRATHSDLGRSVDYYELRLTPKPRAPIAWGRITYTIIEDGELVLPTEAKYYRKKGDTTPVRTLHFLQVKKLGGRMVPAEMRVTVTKKPGEFTRIVYKKLRFSLKIPDSKFTEQALRK